MRKALIETRRRAGLSQKDVAEAVGISRSFYTLIERGTRNPSLPVALRIARFFGADTRQLFCQSAARPAPPQHRDPSGAPVRNSRAEDR
ncbi:MAG: helix-turn-helix transcriptional regulator [Bacillota bacterium]|nr:helix-turn-helix transcriptional regulator [Bacillota bacterium]